jgi:membrane-bound ClpP family serine protease
MKKHYQKSVLIIIIYGVGLLYAGYWSPSPRLIGIVGFVLGIMAFSVVYSSRIESKYLDLSVFVISVLGSCVGTILIFLSCTIKSKPICSSNSLQAQAFGNFVIPLLFIIALWLSRRLPVILGKNR